MVVSEPAFTCIRMKLVANVQKRVNKRFEMPLMVKFLKDPHFTVMLLNNEIQFFSESLYTIKHLLLLEIHRHIKNSVKHLRLSVMQI